MVISLPPGEQIASLNYTLDTDEAFIGQAESCLIRLPDQLHNIADQHGRLIREDEQWYVENVSDGILMINQVDVPKRSEQRLPLNDGDIIYCGDYQLAASYFSPWKTPNITMEPPELTAAEDQTPEFCVIPSKEYNVEPGHINDPFTEPAQDIDTRDSSSDIDVVMTNTDLSYRQQPLSLARHRPLIDVLSKTDDLNSDWNTHRELWYGTSSQPQYLEEPSSQPETDDSLQTLDKESMNQQRIDHKNTDATPATLPTTQRQHHSTSSDTSYRKSQHHKLLCQAMLQALDQAMTDMSPESLELYFKQAAIPPATECIHTTLTSRLRRCFTWHGKRHLLSGSIHSDKPSDRLDFQLNYQHHYQQLITSKQYRLLFLQRFRQALKEQEQP